MTANKLHFHRSLKREHNRVRRCQFSLSTIVAMLLCVLIIFIFKQFYVVEDFFSNSLYIHIKRDTEATVCKYLAEYALSVKLGQCYIFIHICMDY